MNKMLVTGGAGFIGSNFIRRVLQHKDHNDHFIVNLDALTYAGNLINLHDIEKFTNYEFIHGDITNKNLLDKLFDKYDFDYVINFAAHSHVDKSIENPFDFVNTNVYGTVALLDVSKAHWRIDKSDSKCTSYKPNVKFVQISTDEVYGALGKNGMFTETTPLNLNSPYSASKASADVFARAYYETYKLPLNITRCSNNYGPYQYPEKLIPLMIMNALSDKQLPVYGDGKQIRDWLHVYDHCDAIMEVLFNGRPGEVYNIGGNNEKENIEIVCLILNEIGKSEKLIEYVTDRLGHDRRYAIDNTKIKNELNWSPNFTFEYGLKNTIKWYLDNIHWLEKIKKKI